MVRLNKQLREDNCIMMEHPADGWKPILVTLEQMISVRNTAEDKYFRPIPVKEVWHLMSEEVSGIYNDEGNHIKYLHTFQNYCALFVDGIELDIKIKDNKIVEIK